MRSPASKTGFREAVLEVVADIPPGHLATYGQVALLAGWPGRARQVGWVLSSLPQGTALPWHRVVNALGHVPAQGREVSALEQIRRLREEGIQVGDLGNLNLANHRWEP